MTNIQKLFYEAIAQSTADISMSWISYPAYRERLINWQAHAGVRHWSPATNSEGGLLPFSLDLVPLAGHQLVSDRGESMRHNILAQHLYRYCSFTEHLELEAVVPSCVQLVFAEAPFAIPDALARDAGCVIVDEAWHAKCAANLKSRMSQVVGVRPCRQRKPAFMRVLRLIKASLPEQHQKLTDLVFSCVSETLITGSLNRVPRDTQVLSEIREVLREHAREEGFHHAIFGQLIGVMWDQLKPADRDVAGPLFAIFIAAFLRPDTLAELDGLEWAGFSAKEAQKIVEETYSNASLKTEIARAAIPTMRFMRHYGLFDHAATHEMLEAMDLLRTGVRPTEGDFPT
jgi:hypothetical protein